MNNKKYSAEEMELFGIAERAKKNSKLFETIKKLTDRYDPEKAKQELEDYEYQQDVAVDMEIKNQKEYYRYRGLFKPCL